MTNSNSTGEPDCLAEKTETFRIILMLITLPMHAIVLKVIVKDFQFNLPRHTILFSISLSDAILVCGLFVCGLFDIATTLKLNSTGCLVYRVFAVFFSCSTLVVTSLSITALSVERYIACIHSLHLHQILTQSRVRYGSIFVWVLGLLIGILATLTVRYHDVALIPNPSSIHFIFPAFVIPSSITILIIQVRLFFFSRSKVRSDIAAGTFGAKLEVAHYRKKHFKIAFMASIVAFAFYVCMIPLAVVFIYELLSGDYVSSPTRPILINLSFWNSMVDPLIYGFGMADTRERILRDVKKMKNYLCNGLLEHICNHPP